MKLKKQKKNKKLLIIITFCMLLIVNFQFTKSAYCETSLNNLIYALQILSKNQNKSNYDAGIDSDRNGKIEVKDIIILLQIVGKLRHNPTYRISQNLTHDINLNGTWEGHYSCCGTEYIGIIQNGDEVVATKIVGDDYVPSGQITWFANIKTGEGYGQMAYSGFVNPYFVSGTFEFFSNLHISFTWGGDALHFYKLPDK